MSSEQLSQGITPEQCAAEVMETIPLVMRVIRSKMRRHGSPSLSVPQFRTLMFLYRHPGSSLSSLAEHLGVTRPTASAITERMVQGGFVDRREHPQERRQVVLKLTEAGLNHLQQIRQTARTDIAEMFADLSEAQRLYLVEGLAVLSKVFEETTSDSKSGLSTPFLRRTTEAQSSPSTEPEEI